MALETDLNTTPYFDDYNENKDFYKILFRPGVSVQTRELNQLQTILQKQIERFGDHVFKSGTIVSGCNFVYNSLYPYIKINDLQEDGQPVNIGMYENFYVRNSANLIARVLSSLSGFESLNPNLNTLYLKYINSGNNYTTSQFSNNDLLDVYNLNNQIFSVSVDNGGSGFSNSDSLVIVSALDILVSSGTFNNNEIITQATTGAKLQIVGVFDGENSNNKILAVKPLNTEQLSNTSANSTSWTMEVGYNIVGNTSSATANVNFIIGLGANGVISTDSLGIIQTVSLNTPGFNYSTLPHVSIKSQNGTVSSIQLTPRNYLAQIRIANSSITNPVGFGYSFSITKGIIYQKGFFNRVDPHLVIVSKYSSTPPNVSVGFTSNESLVKFTTDRTLYDNAANTFNETAPGADRLRIKPQLVVIDTEDAKANSEFLPLVEFINGVPAKENRNTVYNEIAKEYERRTYETSGDFVMNSFRTSSKEITSNTTHFNIIVDPGSGYIKGKRVETLSHIPVPSQKANTYFSKSNQTITANYGNYVKVKNLAGFFDFKAGANVALYDTAKSYIGNLTIGGSATITPSGSSIGTARIRSLVYQEGTSGTPDAVYRLYLFDVSMNSGKSFRDVKSFYFDGSYDGICDAVTEIDGTTNAATTFLYDTENPDIIFKTGLSAVRSISDISYTYRTSTSDLTLNANGTIEITAPVGYNFPYSGSISLSTSQKQDFIISPVSNAVSANAGGTVSGNTTTSYLTSSGTPNFINLFVEGDYIQIFSGATTNVKRVVNVVNSTYITISSNLSFTNATSNVALFLPAYYPINLNRTGRSISTSANSSVVTINIGNSSLTSSANVIANYNIKIPSATQMNKDLNRDLYVKIYTGNNNTVSAGGNNTTGPWNLGIPDVFRLKTVYFGNTTSNTDITKYFFINSQDDGDKVKNAELRLIQGANLVISNTQWLLAKFDAFDVNSTEGFITINSYNDIINDAANFGNTTYINTLELPEVLTSEGRYYDSRDSFDFRPFVVNTASYANSVGSATVNPSSTQVLNSDEKYFPTPDTEIVFDIDYYVPRIDLVSISKDKDLFVTNGTPDINNLKTPTKPNDSLSLSRIFVPPYPTLPYRYSNTTYSILDKKVGNDSSIVNNRENNFAIKNLSTGTDLRSSPKSYNMAQIGQLEQRIAAVEKELLLNKLEKSVLQKIIPSSNDPAKDRFKNGFVVDSFNNYDVVDITDIENKCLLDNNRGELLPFTLSYNYESSFDRSHAPTKSSITGNKLLMLPYEEVAMINQLNASRPSNIVFIGNDNSANVQVSQANVSYPVPVISGPSEIMFEDELVLQIRRAQPNETITWSYDIPPSYAINRPQSPVTSDAGGVWNYKRIWIEGNVNSIGHMEAILGLYKFTFSFGTSGHVLTYNLNVVRRPEVYSQNELVSYWNKGDPYGGWVYTTQNALQEARQGLLFLPGLFDTDNGYENGVYIGPKVLYASTETTGSGGNVSPRTYADPWNTPGSTTQVKTTGTFVENRNNNQTTVTDAVFANHSQLMSDSNNSEGAIVVESPPRKSVDSWPPLGYFPPGTFAPDEPFPF